MDDSELDFADICSKLLKRVRKKPDESKQPNRTRDQSSSQAIGGEKTKARNQRKDGAKVAATQPVGAGGERLEVGPGTQCDSGDAGTSVGSAASVSGQRTGEDQRAKDIVLVRMQQFKRDSPQKMMHRDPIQPRIPEQDSSSSTQQQQQDPQTLSLAVQPNNTESSDEALAMKLQQELDREAQIVDLEDGGLFFCQICQKDLSHMTPEGRSQHLNRCLDESEDSAPAPPPAAHVPDCPICGKKFKSQKSRSAHLKRCSSDMGVSPAVLLQALQRQSEESQNITSDTNTHTAGTKRKGSSKPGLPARKKARKKIETLDEETMMALALSSSLLEQQRETQAERLLQTEPAASHNSMTPALKWKSGKGPAKRKKGGVPRPPPLLLIQDAEVALARLQERVSALLLRSRSPSPPTPTRVPSTLSGWKGAAPLWQRSMLLDGGSTSPSDFYAPELREFFPTSASVTTDLTSSGGIKKPETSVQPTSEGTPVVRTNASILPSSSNTVSSSPAPSTPGTGSLLVGSQALRDLMELAEDGMTLTQCGYKVKDQQTDADPSTNLRLSGFVQESEEANDLCFSGFLPEDHHTLSDKPDSRVRTTAQRENGDRERQKSVALSRLASDLSSMVNNPQLSDVQLQVDSGEVFYAHSFMVYARCPLLAELVHESGIGVQEEDVPAAQRVLMNDVPGQAVLALLQYLYTAQCSITASLQPHVRELASRFDLQELQELCHLSVEEEDDEVDSANQEGNQTDRAFLELLRSMWNEGDDDGDGDGVVDSDGEGRVEGRKPEENGITDEVTAGEIGEERVNEDELEEIYEFAATQRQREEKESEEEEEEGGEEVFKKPQNQSLDRSYDRLFSQSGEEGEAFPFQASQSKENTSCRTLQNRSLTPPVSDFPIAGLPPVKTENEEQDADKLNTSTGEKHSHKDEEPELIVLSDSSEEMEVAVRGSPRTPLNAIQSPNKHTQIKPKPDPTPTKAAVFSSINSSPDEPPDCSPELSWLVPSTPQPNTSRSTQTISSMRRTKLFPAVHSPPPSPSALSVQSSVSDLKVSPKKNITSESKGSSVLPQDAPLHQPHSSTPLYTELRKPHLQINAASPLESETSQSENLEKTEVASFHLSPLSEPSDQRSIKSEVNESLGGERGDEDGGKEEDEGERTEAGAVDSSFQFDCMDEPPIAFNDSWGLDVGAEANPGCFSLRLEDSGPPENNTEQPQPAAASSSSSFVTKPPPSAPSVTGILNTPSSPKAANRTSSSSQTHPAPPTPQTDSYLLDPEVWDNWDEEEEEEEELLPLSQRVSASTTLKTPKQPQNKRRRTLVPITPMPHYSDMDTPELKNKLNRFGVRPLPKRQMILKLKEIHQYTHQLSSSSEDEAPPAGRSRKVKTNPSSSSSVSANSFKEPRAPPAASPRKQNREEEKEEEALSASQGSNTSSTAASEESERSNPELCPSSGGDSDSDGGISSSQAASRLQDRLLAVRSYILSHSELYGRILRYQPLVLSQLQEQLKAAGIRIGAAKLVDFLDSQCITFTTAKPGHATAGRRRGGKTGRGTKTGGRGRKKTVAGNI